MADDSGIPRLPATATPAAVIAALREFGCVVIEDLVEPAVMDRIAAELTPFFNATPLGNDSFIGYSTRRTGSLIARSASFRPLANHPIVLGALDEVLGDHATSYQLHLTQIIGIGPGEQAQPIHRDQWAFDFFDFPAGFEVECHCMWAMTDFTDHNGGTRVIPKSHLWADKLKPSFDETVGVEMHKGSVMLYLGSLYHGGGPNRSEAVRLGINVGYTLSWLRQEENQYLACPPEIARQLPAELAKLIGYSRGAYALGYYGDVQDPFEALHGSSGDAPSFTAAVARTTTAPQGDQDESQ